MRSDSSAILFLGALLSLLASACTYTSSSLADFQCEEEGARDGARECRGGVWITETEASLPDMPSTQDMPESPDLQDMPADMSPVEPDLMTCVPQEDTELCQGRTCGSLEVTDNCGVMRTIDCGACGMGEMCDTSAGQCVRECIPVDDAQLCQSDATIDCGETTLTDNCGTARPVDCGECQSGACMDNVCVGCEPQDDSSFCREQYDSSNACGEVTAFDNCNAERTLDCGNPCQENEVCANSVCCASPSDEEVCATLPVSCGDHMDVVDSCGQPRDVQCGECTIFEPDVAIPTASGTVDNDAPANKAPGNTRQSELAFWLRASQGFSSPTQWSDLSGNMRHASISNPSQVGLLPSDPETNYSPMIDFKSDGYVEFDRPASGDFTLAFVFRTNSSHNGSDAWWDEALLFGCELPGGVADFGLTMESGALHFSHNNADDVAVSTGNSGYGDDRVHLVYVKRDRDSTQDNVEISVDGGQVFSGSMTSGDLNDCARLRIARQSDGDGKWTGEVGEVVVWGSDQVARRRVESSLALMYGITIDANYQDHTGATVYERRTFGHNIFGLARSDEYSLRKNRSTSSAEGGLLTLRAGEDAVGGSLLARDHSYLIMGHDNADTSTGRAITLSNGFPVDASKRTWQIQSTNFAERFTLTFDASDIDLFLDTVVVADDANFTQNVRAYQIQDIGADQSVVLEIPSGSTRYLTFADSTP